MALFFLSDGDWCFVDGDLWAWETGGEGGRGGAGRGWEWGWGSMEGWMDGWMGGSMGGWVAVVRREE